MGTEAVRKDCLPMFLLAFLLPPCPWGSGFSRLIEKHKSWHISLVGCAPTVWAQTVSSPSKWGQVGSREIEGHGHMAVVAAQRNVIFSSMVMGLSPLAMLTACLFAGADSGLRSLPAPL